MSTRRAVSPVIATVILIAVAVALGIAVAVWAGALTSSLQKTEKLVISAYPYFDGTNATQDLVLSVTNDGASSVTVTQVQLNGVPIASGNLKVTSSFSAGWALSSGVTGTLTVYNAAAVLSLKDGVQYPLTIVTAAGNSYPSTITWP